MNAVRSLLFACRFHYDLHYIRNADNSISLRRMGSRVLEAETS